MHAQEELRVGEKIESAGARCLFSFRRSGNLQLAGAALTDNSAPNYIPLCCGEQLLLLIVTLVISKLEC